MPRCGTLTKGMDSGTLGPPAILRRSFLKGELQQPLQRSTPLLKPALQRLKESMKDRSYHLPRGQTAPLHRSQPSYSLGWASWLFRRSPKRLPKCSHHPNQGPLPGLPFSHNGRVLLKSHLLLPKRKQTGFKNRNTTMRYEHISTVALSLWPTWNYFHSVLLDLTSIPQDSQCLPHL